MSTASSAIIGHTSKRLRTLFLVLISAVTLSGCVTALVAGAAITTIDILHDRRTAGEYIDDGAIEVTAKKIVLANPEFRKASHIKPVSWNGILLITGEVTDEAIKQQILEKLNNIQAVRQIVDETEITDRSKFLNRTNDSWISSNVKSRLILKTGLKANRVNVNTTRGSVYLMGIVTREEADKATAVAQAVPGVKRVVKVFEYQETQNP